MLWCSVVLAICRVLDLWNWVPMVALWTDGLGVGGLVVLQPGGMVVRWLGRLGACRLGGAVILRGLGLPTIRVSRQGWTQRVRICLDARKAVFRAGRNAL